MPGRSVQESAGSKAGSTPANTVSLPLKGGERRRNNKRINAYTDDEATSAVFINSYHHLVAETLVHISPAGGTRRRSSQLQLLQDRRRTAATALAAQKQQEAMEAKDERREEGESPVGEQRRRTLRAPPGFERTSQTRSPLSGNSPPSVRRIMGPQLSIHHALAPSWLTEKPQHARNKDKLSTPASVGSNAKATAAGARAAHCSALYTPPESPAESPSSSWAHAQPGAMLHARRTEEI